MGECEITVGIGGAEHSFHGSYVRIIAPLLGLFVTATLKCGAGLQLSARRENKSGLHIESGHTGTTAVVTLEHGIAGIVRIGKLAQGKDIAQVGIETFDQQIGLH